MMGWHKINELKYENTNGKYYILLNKSKSDNRWDADLIKSFDNPEGDVIPLASYPSNKKNRKQELIKFVKSWMRKNPDAYWFEDFEEGD